MTKMLETPQITLSKSRSIRAARHEHETTCEELDSIVSPSLPTRWPSRRVVKPWPSEWGRWCG